MSIKKLSYPILLIVAAMTLAACHDEDHDSHASSAAHSSQTLTPSQSATSSDSNAQSDNNTDVLPQKQKMEHPAQN